MYHLVLVPTDTGDEPVALWIGEEELPQEIWSAFEVLMDHVDDPFDTGCPKYTLHYGTPEQIEDELRDVYGVGVEGVYGDEQTYERMCAWVFALEGAV